MKARRAWMKKKKVELLNFREVETKKELYGRYNVVV